MTDLLFDEKSRRELARFLKGKKKPHAFNLKTWTQLLRGEQSSIALKDLRVLQKYYPDILGVIEF